MSDFGLFRVSFISDFDSSIGDDIAVYHQIEFEEATPQQSFPCQAVDDCTSIEQQIHDDDDDDSSLIYFYASESSDYRLSLAGMTCTCDNDNEPVDELYSGRYSAMIDTLRNQLMECLPQTESMFSRSIIHAFSSSYTQASYSDDRSSLDTGNSKTAADLVQEAREWVALQLGSTPADREQYLQEQMDAVFAHVRNQELSSDDALQIVLGIASVLGLEPAEPAPANLVNHLGPSSTDDNKENESAHSTSCSNDSLPQENTGVAPHILGKSLLRSQERYSNLETLKQKRMLKLAVGYASSSTTTTKKQQSNPWRHRLHRPNALLRSQLRRS
jgi:hypothetical protein